MKNQLIEFSYRSLQKFSQILIVGDIHGDLASLKAILQLFDERNDLLIFLGDYADRGPKGFEVINSVFELLKKFPNSVIALKGNHEDYESTGEPRFSPFTLKSEVLIKYGSWEKYFKDVFRKFEKRLYLAAILADRYLLVHGGVSSAIVSRDSLANPPADIQMGILWSDPTSTSCQKPNPRGAGVLFPITISEHVAERLNIQRIIRSHQPQLAFDKPHYSHKGRVVTVSSTIVYGGRAQVLKINPKRIGKINYFVF